MEYSNSPGNPLPLGLSDQLTSIVQASGLSYDIGINGIPFLLKPSGQDPYLRQILSGTKDQFDDSGEAGENSFGDWWLRSQGTFHNGQGQQFLDTQDDPSTRLRFNTSSEMYVGTPGQAEPWLPGHVVNNEAFFQLAQRVRWSTTDLLAVADISVGAVYTYLLSDISVHGTHAVGTGAPLDMVNDGVNLYVASPDNKIYRVDSTATVTEIYHSGAFGTGVVKLGFAHERLMLAVGPKLYELDPNPSGTSAITTPHHTHPVPEWRYTAIVEGPNGIFLAGYSGPRNSVSSMTLVDAAGTVTLGQPIQHAQLPNDEEPRQLLFYTGSLAGFTTSRGVRVCSFTPYGQLQLGRLLLEGSECAGIAAQGQHLLVGSVGNVWAVNLSSPLDDAGGFAVYHRTTVRLDGVDSTHLLTDLVTKTDSLVMTNQNNDLCLAPADIGSGDVDVAATLVTSWVRFGTTELKRLHHVTLDGDFALTGNDQDAMTVVVRTSSGETATFHFAGGTDGVVEYDVGQRLSAAPAFRLEITLRENDGNPSGIHLRSWQMKALPAPTRREERVYPLLLADVENPTNGQPFGYPGFLWDRLNTLIDYASRSDQVNIVDRRTKTSFRAVIDRVQFRQDRPPSRTNPLAGIASVVLKLV